MSSPKCADSAIAHGDCNSKRTLSPLERKIKARQYKHMRKN